MDCVSCDICVYHPWFVFFPRVFLSSRVTGACPVTTDSIMRVNVRTTTTTISADRELSLEITRSLQRAWVCFQRYRKFMIARVCAYG